MKGNHKATDAQQAALLIAAEGSSIQSDFTREQWSKEAIANYDNGEPELSIAASLIALTQIQTELLEAFKSSYAASFTTLSVVSETDK